MTKSSLITNSTEHHREHGLQLMDAKTYPLLGIETGWKVGEATLQERLCKARRVADRAQLLRLPQGLFQRLAATFIQPLLYGTEYICHVKSLQSFDRSLRCAYWGRARTAASWGAIMAYGIPAHVCTALGARHQRLFASIWMSSLLATTRSRIMSMWESNVSPRHGSLWESFLEALASSSMQLVEGGGLRRQEGDGLLVMHLNMPKKAWMHGARLLWKQYHMGNAARLLPWVFPPLPHLVDWQLTLRPAGQRSVMLATIQCNGLNTRARAHHHFDVQCGDQCEYGCGEPDDVEHRLLRCRGLQQVRDQLGITQEDIGYLNNLHPCHYRCAVWLLPVDYLPWRIPPQQAWQLWPNQHWMARVNLCGLQPSPVVMHFHYMTLSQGRHPELQRHGAALETDLGDVPSLMATASGSSAIRRTWELDALQLAALVAIRCDTQVHVIGLQFPLELLWKAMKNYEGSNTHLVTTAVCAEGASSSGFRSAKHPDWSSYPFWGFCSGAC